MVSPLKTFFRKEKLSDIRHECGDCKDIFLSLAIAAMISVVDLPDVSWILPKRFNTSKSPPATTQGSPPYVVRLSTKPSAAATQGSCDIVSNTELCKRPWRLPLARAAD